MEKDIRQGKYLEFGEYRGNLYGTLADSVLAVMKQGHFVAFFRFFFSFFIFVSNFFKFQIFCFININDDSLSRQK